VSWYWHFVDVVWLLLFVLVYWLWRQHVRARPPAERGLRPDEL